MPEDSELAKLLVERQKYCKELELDNAELSNSNKILRSSVKDWQDRFNHLMYKLNEPSEVQPKDGSTPKLLGFQIRPVRLDGQVSEAKTSKVYDLLSALNRLLAIPGPAVKGWALVPVFQGDVTDPVIHDENDLEDGDVCC